MITAVDTNVLLDYLIPDSTFGPESEKLLFDSYRRGQLVICDIVYAEILPYFDNPNTFSNFMNDVQLRRDNFSSTSLQMASQNWQKYLDNKSRTIQCPSCGTEIESFCKECEEVVTIREHILADFLIGGHASEQANRLLTRDRGYFQTYFEDLAIVDPSNTS